MSYAALRSSFLEIQEMHNNTLNDPYLMAEIVDTIRDPLLVLDDALRVVYASRNFYETFHVTEKQTIDQYIYKLGNEQWNIPDFINLLHEILPKQACIEEYEIRHEFPSIGKKVMLLNARRVISPNNSTLRILLVIEDITEKQALKDKLVEMATTDQLTGLYNRYKFYDVLDDRIRISERSHQTVALLSLDLDFFKVVNDTFGHKVGDELLKVVASRILTCIRATDTPARLGGDEFSIIVFNPHSLDELKLLIQRIIDHVSAPVVIQGAEVKVGVCIGVSLLPSHTTSKEELLKLSDDALYKAKAKGTNQFLIHEADV